MFDDLMGRIAGRFARVEPRRRARSLVLGLLSNLPRKNCWTIAEHAGHATPDGLQHLLARAKWDAEAVRDDLRGYVVEQLGDQDAVLVVDETGDLKKGTHTVGVQRQYTGTAGARISMSARQRGVGGSLRYDPVSVRPRCRSCSAGQVRSDPAALR
jgi:SRSO17 transposase